MSDLTPQRHRVSEHRIDPSRGDAFGRSPMGTATVRGVMGGRGRSVAASSAVGRSSVTQSLRGLRIVLHERDRRGSVLRCLSSARWLAMRGAELVLVDGVAGLGSGDDTRGAVARRFPSVSVVPSPQLGGVQALLKCYSAVFPDGVPNGVAVGVADGVPAPHTVLYVDSDLEVERFRVEHLVREHRDRPSGTVLVPGLIGPDGAAFAPERHGAYAWPSAWIARSKDLAAAGNGRSLQFAPARVSFVAPSHP